MAVFELLLSAAFKTGLSAAIQAGKKSEFIIDQLKKLGLEPEHPGPGFGEIYAHALVVYRVEEGREEFLNLLRDHDVTEALRKNWENLSDEDYKKDIVSLIERLAAGDKVKGSSIDVNGEADRFWNIFKAQVHRSRPPSQVEDHLILTKMDKNVNTLIVRSEEPPVSDEMMQDLITAALMGTWMDTEEDEGDKIVAEELSGKSYDKWINSIRLASLGSLIPVSIKEKRWKFERSQDMKRLILRRLFDADLDRFKSCALAVLNERNPKFELPPSDRIFADIRGKKLSFSKQLRNGLSETMAILGCESHFFTSCPVHKAEGTAYRIVYDLFSNADGILWASLDDLLPTLAEASPEAFLHVVKEALEKEPTPFSEVFAQEGSGFFGSNYTTGLLWGLERLAWNPDFMPRVVLLLGDLASIDPGGNWANRPINSIKDIFLLWRPHTLASVDIRHATLITLLRDHPDIGWQLLLRFLPGGHESTSGTARPIWRTPLPEGYEQLVSNKDYIAEVNWVFDCAIGIVTKEIEKLCQLVKRFSGLWETQRQSLLKILTSDVIIDLPEDERLPLWEELIDLRREHTRFADADWAMSPEWVAKLIPAIDEIEPKSLTLKYRHLFVESMFDLYEPGLDWDDARKALEEKKQLAIINVHSEGGMDAVYSLAEKAQSPFRVGESFGIASDFDIDNRALPILETFNHPSHPEFIRGFVWGRFYKHKWEWVDRTKMDDWNPSQISKFFAFLPFTNECWERVAKSDPSARNEYWRIVHPNLYDDRTNLEYAIDSFINIDRLNEAINCAHFTLLFEKSLSIELSYRILKTILNSEEIQQGIRDWRTVIQIIKSLQNNTETPVADLENIEWAYLELLVQFGSETYPIALERKMATDPNYYCLVVRSIYKSKHNETKDITLSEKEERIVGQFAKLLWHWRTPPGTTRDGLIDNKLMTDWIEQVKKQLEESGHWEHGAYWIGHALYYAPKVDSVLKESKEVIEILDRKSFDRAREGYRINYFNTHGSMSGDFGFVERQRAIEFRDKALKFESAGYLRFAEIFKELARDYEHMAESDAARSRFDD